ncbi:hypothetical protein NERG_02537 [Nematocida ausubeli]|uniref:Uncharacterized protein n=1 Tax=Nematocida ausubeli (strain ATCC PRA-371 / ERTm2) TaxID=1913371 RepID=H8ZG16_NEMA1|nr:hypothetical protein NERG_02537 [Nematocida ausubeli]
MDAATSDRTIGIGEGIDNILASGSMGEYKKGVILGYFDSLDLHPENISGKTTQKALMEMQEKRKDVYTEIFKVKNLLEW